MQSFHRWLSAAPQSPDPLRERLARLKNAKRERIREVTHQLTWYIWS
jgi:hypothetical protein